MSSSNKAVLDAKLCDNLDTLVEELTTSGQADLDNDKMKQLKNICKLSDDYVRKCFYACMTQLEKEHSEIRLSCTQLINTLFIRSHCFRDLLLADFQYFMELTIETNGDEPLPPPKSAAKKLKTNTIECVHLWHEKFGDVYKKLALGYNYLKTCKKVNFQDVHARNVAEQQREVERTARIETQNREKLQKTLEEMAEMHEEIKNIITQTENCLILLLPHPDSFHLDTLKSPDIFPNMNPWKTTKHVNKSTKFRNSSDEKISENSENDSSSNNEKVDSTSHCHVLKLNKSDDKNTEKEKGDTNIDNKANDSTFVKSVEYSCKYPNQKDLIKKVDLSPLNRKDNSIDLAEFDKIQDSDEDENYESSDDNDDDIDEYDELSDDNNDDMMRGHGFSSQAFSISVDLVPSVVEIQENSDNMDIIHTLKDSVRLMDYKFLPAIQKWLEVYAKRGAEQCHIKKALDLRQAINKTQEKVGKLKILKAAKPANTAEETDTCDKLEPDSDDDDFEEVAMKEGYEPKIPDHLRAEYGLIEKPCKSPTHMDWELPSATTVDDDDPTTSQPTLRMLAEQLKREGAPVASVSAASSGKKQKYDNVPVVPFNMDLYHWGEKLETPLMVKYDMAHRFWTADNSDDTVDVNALELMKSRIINYTGEFKPVKWTCRAALPSGKLCPRMDRYKCPFHGKIIPRDGSGQPSDMKDKVKLILEEETKEKQQDWDDPELQAEILAATGKDLSRKGKSKKGKKGKQKKFPGLTDINKVANPVRKRLEQKVLNSGAISRVANALSAIDERKRKDKFGNSFHYVHGPRKS